MKKVIRELVVFLVLAMVCVLGLELDVHAEDKVANFNTIYYLDGATVIDGENYYKVILPESGRLTIQYAVSKHGYVNGDPLTFYDSAGNKVFERSCESGESFVQSIDLVAGTYEVWYSVLDVSKGNFKLIFTSAEETLKDSLEDKHDTVMTAAPINTTSETIKAQFALNNYTDYYEVKVKKDGIYKMTINTTEISSINFEMVDEFGKFNYYQSGIPMGKRVFNIPVKKGTYYLKFDSESTGIYEFITTLSSGTKTSISSMKNSSEKEVKITWKPESSVSGYQVQIATNKGFTKSKKSATIIDNAQSSKTFKDLKKGKKYYVRVRTYTLTLDNKKVYSSWSVVKSVKVRK